MSIGPEGRASTLLVSLAVMLTLLLVVAGVLGFAWVLAG